MLTLRQYQRDSIDAVWNYFRAGHKGNPLICAPTGSGKSLILAAICKEVLEQWPDQRLLIVAHTKELLQQNFEELIHYWPEAPAGLYSAGLGMRQLGRKITIGGIQSIYSKAGAIGWKSLVLIDECHRLPHDGEGTYHELIEGLKKINPNLRVIGLTATPYRMKSGLLTEPGGLFTDIVYDIEIPYLIANGYLCPIISKSPETQADLSEVRTRGGEYVPGDAAKAMDDDELTREAIAEIRKYAHDRKSIMVFCAGVEHSEHVARALRAEGFTAEAVSGESDNLFRAQHVNAFKEGRLRFLCNCDLYTVGFNAKNVDCIVFLRPTKSTGLYVQMCLDAETEILTDQGWRTPHTILPTDLAATFAPEDDSVKFEPIDEIVQRLKSENEFFVYVDSPHLNMRITNQHDLVVRAKGGKAWRKETAARSLIRKDNILLPVAGRIQTAGSGLSRHELSFLGWFLSDGTLNKINNAITISQSADSEQHAHIVETLNGCGLRYGVHRTKRRGIFAKYPDLVRYSVSYGDARIPNGTGKSGWNGLKAWVSADKTIGPAYDSLTRDELLILLDSLNRGDGAKFKKFGNKPAWTPRTMSITCGLNKKMVDRLQALCVTRGIRCNIKLSGKSNWMLYAAPQKTRAVIRGTRIDDLNRNARLKVDPSVTPESVWCVRTKTGTIITRRRGKVVIMGNCGRAMRTFPGKKDALILDFAGNIERHGPVDMVRIQKKSGGGSEVSVAPVKLCSICRVAMPISATICPGCGATMVIEKPVHDVRASTAAVLSAQIKPEELEVESVQYKLHKKEGKPTSLRVMYHCKKGGGNLGYTTVSEWVCLEHPGYAFQKAVQWWLRHHKNYKDEKSIQVPISVLAALDQTKDLRRPARILVRVENGFDRVVRVDFHENEPEPVVEEPEDELSRYNL